jgi:hypothetical protein
MGWEACWAARSDNRRHLLLSNFTATLPSHFAAVSGLQRATSTIIEALVDMSYGLWDVASAFWDVIGGLDACEKRVWVLGKPEGASGFCGWRISEMK